MFSVAAASTLQLFYRLAYLFGTLVVLALFFFLTGPKVGAIIEALTPPRLPPPMPITAQVWHGDQNWTADQAERFHFEPQGTHTLPVPLEWLLALEEPAGSLLSMPFSKKGRFTDSAYLSRLGFISSPTSKLNPHGLPIGFAVQAYQTLDGLESKQTSVGLTCAACHTGQVIYNGTRHVIDGGPAAIDLGLLTNALSAALGQTAISAKLPFFGGRFDRFARAVLKERYSDATRNQLENDLGSVISALAKQPSGVAVTEGFSRLDALNRIGNQVFALDTGRPENYVPINAPVVYPHIWTSSWFDWVQYDASIMQPMIRNAGEALGVRAQVDFTSPPDAGRFASSIPFGNLSWLETQLAGPVPPLKAKSFTGLNAPSWPESFPKIDTAKATEGAKLYDKLCSGCHRPALTRNVANGKEPDSPFWEKFKPIRWTEGNVEKETTESYFTVKIIPQKEIGTDPAQGAILAERTVNTAGKNLGRAGEFSSGLGLNVDVCKADKNGLRTTHISDGAMLPYPYALGAVVQMTIEEYFRAENPDAATRAALVGEQPNCLLAGAGYKARPLNGIWATAPYLHNGSVPTLYHLLSPVNERPKAFLLGNHAFDPVRLGLVVRAVDPKGLDYDEDGYFILDTSRPGNRNVGHEFADDKREGVIGPALTPEQRNAIIEFLKTL